MQLSLHADYSCRVLIYLAINVDRCSIEEISNAYSISKNHLVKLVNQMGKMNFILTTRGRGGGIQLARPANQISIGDVIRKMEPNLDIVECFNSDTNRCPITGACGLKPWLKKATEDFLKALDEVSLEEAAGEQKKLKKALHIKTTSQN